MCKCGRPIQGLLHDLSKFTPTEFIESVKFYQGNQSPINVARDVQGYSDAWLHHKGRNKHHTQYWVDLSFGKITCAEMPWKYLVEFICDGIGAGKAYARNQGKEWTEQDPLSYWETKDQYSIINEKTKAKIRYYYEDIANRGWDLVARDIRKKGDYYESTNCN